MVHKQKCSLPNDELKRVEAQLQIFMEESMKQMDRLEDKHENFENKIEEFSSSNKRIEEMLVAITFQNREEPSILERPLVAGVHGDSPAETGQSLVGANIWNHNSPITPYSWVAYLLAQNLLLRFLPPPH